MDESNSYKVADISLADAGERRVDWARARMPVLARLKAEAEKNTKKGAGEAGPAATVRPSAAVRARAAAAATATPATARARPTSGESTTIGGDSVGLRPGRPGGEFRP